MPTNDEVKKKLDSVGAGFCLEKWTFYLEESLEYIKAHFNEETVDRFNHVISRFKIKQECQASVLERFIVEYDKRRNKNFLEVFPECDFLTVPSG